MSCVVCVALNINNLWHSTTTCLPVCDLSHECLGFFNILDFSVGTCTDGVPWNITFISSILDLLFANLFISWCHQLMFKIKLVTQLTLCENNSFTFNSIFLYYLQVADMLWWFLCTIDWEVMFWGGQSWKVKCGAGLHCPLYMMDSSTM